MKRMNLAKIAIATTAFACTALLSVGWSERRGASLSIESAQARGSRVPSASVAGVARPQNRRAAYGYGAGAVGAGVTAAAIGTTAAVAAATSPWGYYGNGYYGGSYAYAGGPYAYEGTGYFAASPWGDYECRNPHGYACNPHAAKDWGGGYAAPAVTYYGRSRANYGGAYIGF